MPEADANKCSCRPVLTCSGGVASGASAAPGRGCRPTRSSTAAIRLADAEGLEAVSMARVAAELGFTTMSLYRYVASKDELLQLMWNASARGAEGLVLEGDGWRARLRMWAIMQRDMLDRHPWITQMPMAAPPMAPNSMHLRRARARGDGRDRPARTPTSCGSSACSARTR